VELLICAWDMKSAPVARSSVYFTERLLVVNESVKVEAERFVFSTADYPNGSGNPH
jgi:hypothetical protein